MDRDFDPPATTSSGADSDPLAASVASSETPDESAFGESNLDAAGAAASDDDGTDEGADWPGAELAGPSPNSDDCDDGANAGTDPEEKPSVGQDVADGCNADVGANDEEQDADDDPAGRHTPPPAPNSDEGDGGDGNQRSIISVRVARYRVPDAEPEVVESNDANATAATELAPVVIPYAAGTLAFFLDWVLRILLASTLPLFVFNGRLVTVGRVGTESHNGVVAILPLTASRLRLLLSTVIRFVQEKGKEAVPMDAPTPLLKALLERPSWPFGQLRRITPVPQLLPGGAVIHQPGYHAASETYYSPDPSFTMARMLDAPTIEDARAAVARYRELLVDALFKTPGALAAAIAAVITPLVRSAIDGAVPLFVADSAVSRIGKTELVNLVALLLTGRPAQVQPPVSPKELEKRITVAVKYGDLLFAIDNGVGQLGGPVLESLVTARVWIGRILGATEKLAGPIEFTLFYTGNHVEYHRDMLFRVVIIGLGTKLESPGERPLQRPDLQAYALQNRGSLIADAFTIARAYMLAGSPDMGLPAIHGFDSWSRVVRSALVWAGLFDPLTDVFQARRDADPETETMGVALEALAALFPPGVHFTAQDVQDRLRSPWQLQNGTDAATGRLSAALEFLFHDKKAAPMNPHSFGQQFKRLTDRTVGGYHLARINSGNKGNVFKMECIASK